jgi:hypothetical protein
VCVYVCVWVLRGLSVCMRVHVRVRETCVSMTVLCVLVS